MLPPNFVQKRYFLHLTRHNFSQCRFPFIRRKLRQSLLKGCPLFSLQLRDYFNQPLPRRFHRPPLSLPKNYRILLLITADDIKLKSMIANPRGVVKHFMPQRAVFAHRNAGAPARRSRLERSSRQGSAPPARCLGFCLRQNPAAAGAPVQRKRPVRMPYSLPLSGSSADILLFRRR